MFIYILVFILVVALYYLQNCHISKTAFRVLMAILAIFVGLSDMLGGYDRYIYGQLFDSLADDLVLKESIFSSELFNHYRKEPGYVIYNALITYLTSNRYFFIFITTCLIYFLFYKSIIKETRNYGYALILFLGLYFFFTFTYIRQAIAIGLAWYSYRFIVNRDFKRFCLFIILSASFHNSTLLFFPVYFLPEICPSRKTILIGAGILLIIGISGVPSKIFDFYGLLSGNSGRAQGYLNDNSGFRIEYILEAIVFLCFFINNSNHRVSDRRNIIHFNIALCFCAILFLFCKSLNGGRLCWPFMLGLICALSDSVNNRFRQGLKPLMPVIISFLLYLRILTEWGILVYPYKTFLTSGVREGDYIYMKYEYDYRYAEDKLYR